MSVRLLAARIPVFALVVLAMAAPALAGPPLLCHPFAIGPAKSLPWNGSSWFEGQKGYDLGRLVSDTQALLVPDTPVVVRMETLRRASIYASQDRKVAAQLLAALTDRAAASKRAGRPDALAFLDAAYVTGALRQIGMLGQMAEFRDRAPVMREVVGSADPYALMLESLAAGSNPSLEFAAALIASDSRRDAYQTHAQKARAGVRQDALLARNIDKVGG